MSRTAPASPRVSVIMAVYNAAETILCAVRSVVDQTEVDLELILVDDGSSDGSLDVVRADPSGDDPRVRYESRALNGGAAAARNTGVGLARGEFVCFIDSDDEFLPTYIESLLSGVGPATDIVVGSVIYVRSDGSRQVRRPAVVGEFPGPQAARLGLLDRITPFTCDKLIRRTLFAGLQFPEGLINEDFLTNPVLASRARSVRVIDESVYLYRVRSTSVTWGPTPPVEQLAEAESFLRRELADAPAATLAAIEPAMVLLTVITAQRALIRSPMTSHDRAAARACRRRLAWSALLRALRMSPTVGIAGVALKTAPAPYIWLYRRHVRQTYGSET